MLFHGLSPLPEIFFFLYTCKAGTITSFRLLLKVTFSGGPFSHSFWNSPLLQHLKSPFFVFFFPPQAFSISVIPYSLPIFFLFIFCLPWFNTNPLKERFGSVLLTLVSLAHSWLLIHVYRTNEWMNWCDSLINVSGSPPQMWTLWDQKLSLFYSLLYP